MLIKVGIDFTGLISKSLSQHTKEIITNSQSETLTFYFDNFIGNQNIRSHNLQSSHNVKINTIDHSKEEIFFIRSIFNKLDELIDLDFSETSNSSDSNINFHSVLESSTFDENTLGEVIKQKNHTKSWWDILWKNKSESKALQIEEKYTLIHEIGHSLGLSHPFESPTNDMWDTKDTVMSYNFSKPDWNNWFSEHDIEALINIWGREDDNGFLKFNLTSGSYKFIKKKDNKYFLEHENQKVDITGLSYVKFSDKTYYVKKDIIKIFDQLDSIDDISSKVYRLYRAAFGRFPDSDGLNYWITKNRVGENNHLQTAKSFLYSNEFNEIYSHTKTNRDYLTNLYQNVLDRVPDEIGYNYWLNQLENNLESRSEVLIGFAESKENKQVFMYQTGLL